MATSPTQLSDEQLKQQLEGGGAQAPPEQPTGPIEYRTETGQVYKGNSWEEVAQEIAKAQEHASRTIREQREEREQLLAELREREAREVKTPSASPKEFDKVKFYNTWGVDPYAAEKEVIKQVLAEEFGVESFDELRQGYQFAYQKSLGLHQNEELFKFFAAHPEYTGSEEDAAKMTEWIEKNYDFDPSKQKFVTADQFEYAYYKLIEEGRIAPPEPAEAASRTRPEAPPTLDGSAPPGMQDKIANADTLPDKELESLMRSLGMLKG